MGARGKDARLRYRMQYDLGVPACNARVPASHGRTVPVPVHSFSLGRQLGHPGPVRSNCMARPSPLLPVCLVIAILSFAPLVTCPCRHILPKPRYAETLATAPSGSAVDPHVDPR